MSLLKYCVVLSSLVLSCAYAQEKKTIEIACNDSEAIFKALTEQYGEQPFVFGRKNQSSTSIMSLWLNPDTQSWSLLVTDPEKTCAVLAGEGMIVQQPRKNGTPL